jgi:hypothetical protein
MLPMLLSYGLKVFRFSAGKGFDFSRSKTSLAFRVSGSNSGLFVFVLAFADRYVTLIFSRAAILSR